PIALFSGLVMVAAVLLTLVRYPGELLTLRSLGPLGFYGVVVALSTLGLRALLRYLRRREITVGTDGIAWTGRARGRFGAHEAIASVERDAWGVLLRLAGGGTAHLPLRPRRRAPLPTADAPTGDAGVDAHLRERATLIQRIEEARAAGGTSARALALLDRS